MEQNLLPTEEETARLRDVFDLDKANLVWENPWFGLILMDLKMVPAPPEIPIAAVSYSHLYLQAVSQERLDKAGAGGRCYWSLEPVLRRTILAHEILHPALDHLSYPHGINPRVANIAQDCVINRILARDPRFDFKDLEVVSSKKDVLVALGRDIPVPGIDDMDWYEIYLALMDNLELDRLTREQADELCSALNGALGGDASPQSGNGRVEESPESQRERRKFLNKVVAVTQAEKDRGSVPAEAQRMCHKLVTPQVEWTSYLYQLVRTRVDRNDFSMKPCSRKAHIAYLPTMQSLEPSDVWLAIDTSGSMSEGDVSQGLSEFASLRQAIPFRLHLVDCDAKVHAEQVYEAHEEPDWTSVPIKGGGGTDFEPIFEAVAASREQGTSEKPSVLVVFTDTMGSFPDEAPDYPVIWVTNYEGASVPFGDLIKIDRYMG